MALLTMAILTMAILTMPVLTMKVRVVTESDLAFDSSKDLAEQPTDAEADDWERRLNAPRD